jgi:simple sugar transport system permease protein
LLALLIEKFQLHAGIAIPLVLILGTSLGAIMGSFIHYFALPSFLVTLAGMFFARGLALVLSLESISINQFLDAIASNLQIPLGGGRVIPATAIFYFAAFAIAIWVAHFTRFGRNVYAIGGNEQSSVLMGLPVARTKIGVYALSGFCSALAGVVYTL